MKALRFVVAAVLLPFLTDHATAADQPPDRSLLEEVVAAIESNNALIQSGTCTVTTELRDPRESENRVDTFKDEQGRPRTTVYHIASSSTTTRVAFKGDRIRCDESMTFPEFARVIAFDGEVWTDYHPDVETAWIKRPGEFPDINHHDPRHMATLNNHYKLTELLSTFELLSAEEGEDASEERIVRIRIKVPVWPDAATSSIFEYEFGRAVGLLPVRLTIRYRVPGPSKHAEFAYQSVLGGKARFLKSAEIQAMVVQDRKRPDELVPGQSQSVSVSDLVLNEAVADEALDVTLPPGTHVYDNRDADRPRVAAREQSMHVASEPAVTADRPMAAADVVRITFGIAAVVAALLAAVIVYARRRRSPA